MGVHAVEPHLAAAFDPGDRVTGVVGQQAELRARVTGRLRRVGGRLDAGDDPDQTRLPLPRGHDALEPVDVVEVVHHDQADAVLRWPARVLRRSWRCRAGPAGPDRHPPSARSGSRRRRRRRGAGPLRPSPAERRCTGTTSTRTPHRSAAIGRGTRPGSRGPADAGRLRTTTMAGVPNCSATSSRRQPPTIRVPSPSRSGARREEAEQLVGGRLGVDRHRLSVPPLRRV